ncbi:PREDICTED: receptor expression-enhancing protein 1-like isoform X2 [Priapulus caudatus]|uniref:Receptor expression-enhancing protein n=1 Tax=Priapulus caudatus TaxID=37621 RepID=A0ABM1E2V6_PRICU|nr:PREDICTED: receptor expression-enhancing protein 1-like isoform X2 [Priapulus caudatus]
MLSAIFSRIVILLLGTLYPAYASYKAVKTKNVNEYVKWMMYWIVFALFTAVETFADVLVSFWMPFYYEIKIVFVLWLLSPATRGASFLYRKFLHPTLNKREKEIDELIARAGDQGYSALWSISHRGISYASNFVLHTAMKGQTAVISQLKRSYSLDDIAERPRASSLVGRPAEPIIDEDEEMSEEDNRYADDHDAEYSDQLDEKKSYHSRSAHQKKVVSRQRRSPEQHRPLQEEDLYNDLSVEHEPKPRSSKNNNRVEGPTKRRTKKTSTSSIDERHATLPRTRKSVRTSVTNVQY